MAKFISKHGKYVISISKKEVIKFQKVGVMGVYETDDKRIIDILRKNKHYDSQGKGGFTEIVGKLTAKPKGEIITGARGAGTATQLGEDILKENFKEFTALKDEIVKIDGSFRKDASEDKIARYEVLKKELE